MPVSLVYLGIHSAFLLGGLPPRMLISRTSRSQFGSDFEQASLVEGCQIQGW